MKLIVFLFLLFAIVNCDEFENWSDKYSKSYFSLTEKYNKKAIWLENLKFIEHHNSRNLGYVLEMNEYGDMTWNQFKKVKMGLIMNHENVHGHIPNLPHLGLPIYVNWTERGVVTRVKNQFQCGSCWAFSTTGAIESMHAIQTGNLVALSEENLIDCTWGYGNEGCGGGFPAASLDYVIKNGGIDTEASYPLVSIAMLDCLNQDTCPCKFNNATIGATVKGYKKIASGNETDLQYTLWSTGPVSVCIDVTQPFQFYKSGIFSDDKCSTTTLNHAVLAVGYGVDTRKNEYYIVKNSWGNDWGIQGYFLLARNKNNMCGIATAAVCPF